MLTAAVFSVLVSENARVLKGLDPKSSLELTRTGSGCLGVRDAVRVRTGLGMHGCVGRGSCACGHRVVEGNNQ